MAPAGAAASPLQDATTKGLQTGGPAQPKAWLYVSLIGLLLVVSIALFTWAMFRGSGATTTAPPPQTPPVATTAPEAGLPQPPPPPRPPFEEPVAEGPTLPTSQLMYPGAETVLDIKAGRENMLQLRTSDASRKVIDWYVDKLKPTQTIRETGAEAILRTGRTTVIISGRGDTTEIIIRQAVEK
jgi:hypothetical protein